MSCQFPVGLRPQIDSREAGWRAVLVGVTGVVTIVREQSVCEFLLILNMYQKLED